MKLLERFFESRATTFQQVFGADLDAPASPFNERTVTREKALGLSAVFACVRLLTDTISTLPFHAFEDLATGGKAEADPQPDWIERPVPRDPSITRQVHFQQVMTSLLLEGNSFTLAAPSVFNPAELRVLDPRKVEIRRRDDSSVVYLVSDDHGGRTEFDWTQIVHIPLIRLPGELRGISPLEAERRLFDTALATEDLGRRFLKNGNWLSGMVQAPAGVVFTQEQADELIDRIVQKQHGTSNAGRPGLLTGGATWVPLSVTPEQAQFLETMQYNDERTFRIYRCPPALMGMIREGAVSNASAVSQSIAFEKHTVRPLLVLVEAGYSVLMPVRQYGRFNAKGLLAGSPLEQAQLYHLGLSDKWRTVDEVRGFEDLNPFGGKDGGLLETPNNNAPGAPAPVVDPNADPNAGRSIVNVTSPDVHVSSAPVTVNSPPVTVSMPGEKRILVRTVYEKDDQGHLLATREEFVEPAA